MKSIFLCFSGLISIVFIWTNMNFMVYGGVRDFVQLSFLVLSVVLVLASFFFTKHKLVNISIFAICTLLLLSYLYNFLSNFLVLPILYPSKSLIFPLFLLLTFMVAVILSSTRSLSKAK